MERESVAGVKDGLSTRIIPAGRSWDDAWELSIDLPIEFPPSCGEVVVTCSSKIQEYGIGDSVEAAIMDLLTSLSDYYESLEDHEGRLGPPAEEDLKILRKLIRRKSRS